MRCERNESHLAGNFDGNWIFLAVSAAKFSLRVDTGEITNQSIIDPTYISGNPDTKTNGIDGKSLFIEKCASCHHPIKNTTGPALAGAAERAPSVKIMYDWIRNPQKVLASGDSYYNSLYKAYGKAAMNSFPNLTDQEIDAILNYITYY